MRLNVRSVIRLQNFIKTLCCAFLQMVGVNQERRSALQDFRKLSCGYVHKCRALRVYNLMYLRKVLDLLKPTLAIGLAPVVTIGTGSTTALVTANNVL
jgi:hypothetical protein